MKMNFISMIIITVIMIANKPKARRRVKDYRVVFRALVVYLCIYCVTSISFRYINKSFNIIINFPANSYKHFVQWVVPSNY